MERQRRILVGVICSQQIKISPLRGFIPLIYNYIHKKKGCYSPSKEELHSSLRMKERFQSYISACISQSELGMVGYPKSSSRRRHQGNSTILHIRYQGKHLKENNYCVPNTCSLKNLKVLPDTTTSSTVKKKSNDYIMLALTSYQSIGYREIPSQNKCVIYGWVQITPVGLDKNVRLFFSFQSELGSWDRRQFLKIFSEITVTWGGTEAASGRIFLMLPDPKLPHGLTGFD